MMTGDQMGVQLIPAPQMSDEKIQQLRRAYI